MKIGLLGAAAYAVWTWYGDQGAAGNDALYAERQCTDAINSRYDLSGVKVFRVTENQNGFVAKASGTRKDGTPVRIVCLTSASGTVRDISVEHR